MKQQFKTISYLSLDGELVKECLHAPSQEILLKGYRAMCLTRRMDERMVVLQRQGTISFAISSKGEEACAVASAAALELQDWLYPQYREAGVMFWRVYTPKQYVNHMFGNSKDLSLGRQMPNHFGSKELNVVTVSSPIGTKIPHAAGAAYAMKVQGEKSVAVCYFGDGASSEGDFHVGLNFAAVKKAPVIFFCRNNGYAISTPCSLQFATDGVAPEGVGHGIETHRVDGNDFFAVFEVVSKAKKSCLNGKGPIFIEAMTYRMGAHSTSDDPSRYRSEKESIEKEEQCPIVRLKRYLQKQNLWSDEQEEQLELQIKQQIDEAVAEAKTIALPPLNTMIEDVYFEVPSALKAKYDEVMGGING